MNADVHRSFKAEAEMSVLADALYSQASNHLASVDSRAGGELVQSRKENRCSSVWGADVDWMQGQPCSGELEPESHREMLENVASESCRYEITPPPFRQWADSSHEGSLRRVVPELGKKLLSSEALDDKCSGGFADCGTLCLRVGTVADLKRIDPAAINSLRVKGDYSAVQEEMVRISWGILEQNTDILRWAICKAYEKRVGGFSGRIGRRLESCYQKMMGEMSSDGLFARTGAGRMKVTFITGSDNSFSASPLPIGIRLSKDQRRWRNYEWIWTYATNEDDKYFAIVDLAITLFHELFHALGCGDHRQSSDNVRPCDEIYLAENVARYAFYVRFPKVAASSCRAKAAVSKYYWSDDAEWPVLDCLPIGDYRFQGPQGWQRYLNRYLEQQGFLSSSPPGRSPGQWAGTLLGMASTGTHGTSSYSSPDVSPGRWAEVLQGRVSSESGTEHGPEGWREMLEDAARRASGGHGPRAPLTQ